MVLELPAGGGLTETTVEAVFLTLRDMGNDVSRVESCFVGESESSGFCFFLAGYHELAFPVRSHVLDAMRAALGQMAPDVAPFDPRSGFCRAVADDVVEFVFWVP